MTTQQSVMQQIKRKTCPTFTTLSVREGSRLRERGSESYTRYDVCGWVVLYMRVSMIKYAQTIPGSCIVSAVMCAILHPPSTEQTTIHFYILRNMTRRGSRLMPPRAIALAAAVVTLVVNFSSVAAFKDPHNKFCGDQECYSVLGLTRGADKAEIKKAYRTISLDVHPDKNSSPAAKEKFTVRVASLFIAYGQPQRCIHHSHLTTLPNLVVGPFPRSCDKSPRIGESMKLFAIMWQKVCGACAAGRLNSRKLYR